MIQAWPKNIAFATFCSQRLFCTSFHPNLKGVRTGNPENLFVIQIDLRFHQIIILCLACIIIPTCILNIMWRINLSQVTTPYSNIIMSGITNCHTQLQYQHEHERLGNPRQLDAKIPWCK